MKQFIVSEQEKNLRLDQYLARLMPGAGKSFLYKMLRKKNIVWNGKKAQGNERLRTGDEIKIFFSDETFELFHGEKSDKQERTESVGVQKKFAIQVVYEDDDILIADKPAGVLSQKAQASDYSLNDWFLEYCKRESETTSLLSYTPSVANRLDRNTSGMVLCGKTLAGARYLSDILKSHTLQKYYLAVVDGKITKEQDIEGYLVKNERTNYVSVSHTKSEESSYISTSYRPLKYLPKENMTLLEVHLKTGKPHQIRAHLMSMGHALVGDPKYGIASRNITVQKAYGVKRQLLHCYKLIFPKEHEQVMQTAGRTFYVTPPKDFIKITGDIYGNLEFPRS